MKKVVVTGAGGFIGGALTKYLLSKNVTVYGVDISEKMLDKFRKDNNFIPVIADFSKYEKLSDMINDEIDVFYHLAWKGYGKDTQNFYVQNENISGTFEASRAACELKSKRLVFACSSYEYQKNNIGGKNGLCNIYGAAKTSAKTFAKVVSHKAGVVFCGAIFTNVFGVGDSSERSANSIIRQLLNGENIRSIEGDALYDWTYIDDVVGGLEAIGKSGIDGKEYYVGNSCLRPFKEIITEVRDILSPNSEIDFGAFPDDAFVDYTDIDIYELYRDTGFYPRCDFKESILKTAEWLKEQGIMQNAQMVKFATGGAIPR